MSTIRSRWRLGGWEVIKKYVELGLGISIVTDICLTGSEDVSKVSLQRFFPDRSYGVVVRKKKYLSAAIRQFLEILAPGIIDVFSPETGH